MQNPNCDWCGDNTCSSNPEVRVLPVGGDGNAICCWRHYGAEIAFRRERNKELSKDCQFDLPKWNDLKVYEV